MDIQCIRCGSMVTADNMFCPECGATRESSLAAAPIAGTNPISAPPAQSNNYAPHQWLQEGGPAPSGALSPQTAAPPAYYAPAAPQLKKCPFCAETINAEAIKCRHCGEILDPTRRGAQPHHQPVINVVTNQSQQVSAGAGPGYQQRLWSPGVAALLSFIIPGLGQLYKGSVAAGIIWFIVVPIGYMLFIVPGFILHIICIVTATQGNPYQRGG